MRRPQFTLKTLLWLMAVVAAFAGGSASQRRYMRWHCDDLAEHLAAERERNKVLDIRLRSRDVTIREIRAQNRTTTQQPSPIAPPIFTIGAPTPETDTLRGDPIGRRATN